MKVLIIGGNGFIGSHVVDTFCENGIYPVVLDRSPERYRRPLEGVKYFRAEFGNRGQIEEIISSGIDVVVHLVSSTVPKSSNDDPIFDVQMNLIESIALFELCVKHRVRKVVFASSGGTIYGIPRQLPIPEDHPNNPLCSYGIVKLAIEKYLEFYSHNYGLDYCILRVSNPYGIRQDPCSMQGVVGVFTAKAMRGEQISIWGDGSIVRDFVAATDVAKLCYLATVSDVRGVFNVGSGRGTSVLDLIRLISASLGAPVDARFEPSRTFDVPAIVLDCTKAMHTFNWEPKLLTEECIAEYAGWVRGVLGS